MKTKTTIFFALTLLFGIVSVCMMLTSADPLNYDGVSTSFTVVVTDAEGHSKNYTTPALSLIPYSLSSLGDPFERLDIYLYSKLETSGTVTSWSVSGTQQLEFYEAQETETSASSTIEIGKAGSTWSDGETKELNLVTLTRSQIEGVVAPYGDSDWSYNINAEVNINVNFADGSSDIAEVMAPALSMPFTYSSEGGTIENFSLIIQSDIAPFSLGQEMLVSSGLPIWTLHALFMAITVICAIGTVYYYRTEE